MADDDYGDDFEEEEEVVEDVDDELEPPKLDEPVYHIGDVVEVRSPGRHGWHEGKVSSADFGQSALGDSAVGVYNVRRDIDGSETQQMRAGNLRRVRDARPPGLTVSSSSSTACAPEEFALGKTFPPPSIPAASAEDGTSPPSPPPPTPLLPPSLCWRPPSAPIQPHPTPTRFSSAPTSQLNNLRRHP